MMSVAHNGKQTSMSAKPIVPLRTVRRGHGPASVMHAGLGHAHGPVVTVPS